MDERVDCRGDAWTWFMGVVSMKRCGDCKWCGCDCWGRGGSVALWWVSGQVDQSGLLSRPADGCSLPNSTKDELGGPEL